MEGAEVTWSVFAADNSNNAAVTEGYKTKKTGLTWGDAPEPNLNYAALAIDRIDNNNSPSAYNAARNTSTTDASGVSTMRLTDIVGERTITVFAKVTIDGKNYYSKLADVSFGDGPLSVFDAPVDKLNWAGAYDACNGTGSYFADGVDPSSWGSGTYVGGKNAVSGKMPTHEEYQAVSPLSPDINPNPNNNAQGAAFAAGWAGGSLG
ncbi:MAG: hypothetical protein LBI62_01005 [Candidatus Accumulibacter sp.]|nr:hypothetical protein [Accumulibacter sp.]